MRFLCEKRPGALFFEIYKKLYPGTCSWWPISYCLPENEEILKQKMKE